MYCGIREKCHGLSFAVVHPFSFPFWRVESYYPRLFPSRASLARCSPQRTRQSMKWTRRAERFVERAESEPMAHFWCSKRDPQEGCLKTSSLSSKTRGLQLQRSTLFGGIQEKHPPKDAKDGKDEWRHLNILPSFLGVLVVGWWLLVFFWFPVFACVGF